MKFSACFASRNQEKLGHQWTYTYFVESGTYCMLRIENSFL
jgi:hypothetical protein